ncbi:hypothetical protein Goshw_007717 [Gossypium schwendimanii]|uniref:Uncharacterized protein n=1 Tax=Gossypium schwendimanii TaxID=34291 RepID=A0A7J9N5V9_GOSSC|nr:hypothetical protein [Gossypium schwendimanii]
MMVVESMVKLGLGKDKLRSSKFEERGVCETDHKEDVHGNGNDENSGNEKPQLGRRNPRGKGTSRNAFSAAVHAF